MRETIVWILFCILLAVASFEAGYIQRCRERDDLYKQVRAIDDQIQNMMIGNAKKRGQSHD